jgi:hypothetical protein
MKVIPTRIHGMLDYGMALLLLATPWLFGFVEIGTNPRSVIPILLGIGTAVFSLFTDYEWGAVRAIPMKVHLGIDIVAGIFLAASPWLFGFADEVYLPHLILGILEVGAAILTSPEPTGHREPKTIR